MKEKSHGVGAHYAIDVKGDGDKACAVTWKRRPLEGTLVTHPGVYCPRTNVRDWDEETLWRTYSTLTDVEAVFRSLKSELGLRPIFHQTPKRTEGHLFITVIAYRRLSPCSGASVRSWTPSPTSASSYAECGFPALGTPVRFMPRLSDLSGRERFQP